MTLCCFALNNNARDADVEEGLLGQASSDSVRVHFAEERIFQHYSSQRGCWERLRGRQEMTMKSAEDALKALRFDKVLKDMTIENFLQECDLDNSASITWSEFRGIVDYLVVKEATGFTRRAEEQIRKLRLEVENASSVDDWKSLEDRAWPLKELWKEVTPKKFLRWFEAMDEPEAHEDRIRMLNCLFFTIPLRDAQSGKWRPAVGDKRLISFGKLHGDRMRQDTVVVRHSPLQFPLPLPGPEKKVEVDLDFRSQSILNGVENRLLGNREESYLVGFTTIDLFDPMYLPYVVRAIERAQVHSKVFTTPIVNALLSAGWHSAQLFFYFKMASDVCLIGGLSKIAMDVRYGLLPSQCVLLIVFVISAYHFLADWAEFLVPAIESSMRHKSFSCHEACQLGLQSVLGSFWSIYEMLVSSWFFFIMTMGFIYLQDIFWQGDLTSPIEDKHKWFGKHAIWVEALLFLKITHIIIKLMCVRALGERVIPAYHAMTHLSSRALLFFLFLMYCNAVLTFHAVPIQIYEPDTKDRKWWDPLENMFDILVLQFRVAFLGESAPSELEGEESRVVLRPMENATDVGTMIGKIQNPSTHSPYHHGVQTTNVLFLVLIHILLLNVYISVLSEQYSRIVKKEREHFEKFRATFTRKTTLRFCFCIRRCGKRYSVTSWSKESAPATWIAYQKSKFPDPFDETARPDVIQQLRNLFGRTEEFQRILAGAGPSASAAAAAAEPRAGQPPVHQQQHGAAHQRANHQDVPASGADYRRFSEQRTAGRRQG